LGLNRLKGGSSSAGLLVGFVVVLQVGVVFANAGVLTVLFVCLIFLAKGTLHRESLTILGAKVRWSFYPLFRSHCFLFMESSRLDCHSMFFW